MVVRNQKPPRIQALARASAIIDVIAGGGDEGVGLSDISRETELNKTTAFNLLASLVTLGFVDQEEQSRHYVLGMRNIELGRIAQRRLHIPSLARPFLIDLCKRTNETVSLALPDMLDMLVVDSLQGSQLLQASTYTGSRSMYHCSAIGKSVMAQWDRSTRDTVYRLRGFPRQTEHTITDIDSYEAELQKVLKQGYALDVEENELGVNCVGTSIINGFGEVAGAVSVSGPSNRLTEDVMQQYAQEVIAAAAEISAAMGFDGHVLDDSDIQGVGS